MATTEAEEYASASEVAARIFGVDLWDTSAEILDALFQPNAVVPVKACHSSSKTYTAAVVVALALYEGGDVLTTAPTWTQVKELLWPRIHELIAQSKIKPEDWGKVNETDITLPDGTRAIGLSTDKGVRFQGWHSRPGSFLVVIFDEALGVRPDIYGSVAGIRASGDVRWLLIGNPVAPIGPFFAMFQRPQPSHRRFTIDALDTPNLRGISLEELVSWPEHDPRLDQNVRPYLATRRWVWERYHEWGPESSDWLGRVRGEFPTDAADMLITLAQVEAAAARRAHPYDPARGAVYAGLDVSGPGEDETACYVIQGSSILDFGAWRTPDSRGDVLVFLTPWRHKGLAAVGVDVIGQGYYFARHLQDQGVPVTDINVSTASSDQKRFLNLRAELHWRLREAFRGGMVSGLTDTKTQAQLVTLRYKHDSQGRIVVLPKEELVKQMLESPDRAEALMLAKGAQQMPFRERTEGLRNAAQQDGQGLVTASPSPEQMKPLTPEQRFAWDKQHASGQMGSRPMEKGWR